MSQHSTNRRPMSTADLVEAVHAGRIGHDEAIARLNLTSFAELVETVHMHGLSMWGHRRARRLPASTLGMLAAACGQRQPELGKVDKPSAGGKA